MNSKCQQMDKRFLYLKKKLINLTNCPKEGLDKLGKKIAGFKFRFKTRWIIARRIKAKFVMQNKKWLETPISFTLYGKQHRSGRPEIQFEQSSDRSKRLKTKDLRKNSPLSHLAFATKMNLRASGQPVASKLLEDIIRSPRRASKYRQAYEVFEDTHSRRMSGEEALSTMVEAKLTKHQYSVIRSKDPERFPPYNIVLEAKKACYPKKEDITITATSAEVTVQALLNHTSERVINVQKEIICGLKSKQSNNLRLISKWGFDGSSGHSSYKQMFIGTRTQGDADDSSVFISSIVPIRLVCGNSDNTNVVWQNPRPSSTRYCRPIKINFAKESTQLAIAEKNRISAQIKNLTSSPVALDGKIIMVSHELILTMVDGKICNALTDTASTQRCYICGASSKEFNSIDKMLTRPHKPSTLEFGLSVLHCWIRLFECLLHVGYKLPIKKWQARNQDKEIVAKHKANIQKEFKNRMGLIVDQPKPGFGNSNDGNTARRFFRNADLASEITGVDKKIIERMHVILVTISSGYDINIDNLRKFSLDTAKYFVKLYPWYYMPPTVHKLLIHGPDVISNALLPIGQLSEEAQEARNKDFKKYRENYSRKCSREKCNEDIFNLMLVTSDPVITSYRKLPKKQLNRFPKEVYDLIIPPNIHSSSIFNTDDDDDCSSSASEC